LTSDGSLIHIDSTAVFSCHGSSDCGDYNAGLPHVRSTGYEIFWLLLKPVIAGH
jgi:hypothetical protein